MRFLTWTIRIALFILLLAFAARNTETVTLRFYCDLAWEAPLVVLLLACFAAGALRGLLSALGAVLRQRGVASRLRRELRAAGARADDAPTLPPPPAEG
jgi:uncharacterized integral membrane protein